MFSAILLGAGQSKRMGVDKLLLPWKRKTMLEACLESLLRSEADEVVVVVNKGSRERVGQWDDAKLKVAVNNHFRKGMSSSIRRGLQALSPGCEGVLIALGDQPQVRTRTINALIRAFVPGRGDIVVPVFRGRRGNPVVFDRGYFKELLGLRGDVGARSLIARHPERVRRVRTLSEAVLRDIDEWKDYVRTSKGRRTVHGGKKRKKGF